LICWVKAWFTLFETSDAFVFELKIPVTQFPFSVANHSKNLVFFRNLDFFFEKTLTAMMFTSDFDVNIVVHK